MNQESLRNQLSLFHHKVYNWIREKYSDLSELKDSYLFLNPSIYEVETMFEPISNGNGPEIIIAFGYAFNQYQFSPSIYFSEYNAFCYDALIGAFFTNDLQLYFEGEIVHEIAHHIAEFLQEKFNFDIEDDHDDTWKYWYRILREQFINNKVSYTNRVCYGATQYTK